MKKQLNEELSRINSMMKMISEESFEDTSKPSETIINDVKQTLRYFLNQDNPQADETEVDADGGWFTINGGEDKYVKYYFDVNVKSYGRTTPGRNYLDNGDPGYPDEHEPMDYDITITQIEVGETIQQDDTWTDNVQYEGPDFTDFMSLSFKNGMSGGKWVYDTFDERILETDIEEEINNINENKKMSKKITITESQLQRLMERKHSYTDNTPEGEMEEQESVGPDSAIINLDDEDNEEEMEENIDKKPSVTKSDIIALLQTLGDYMEDRSDVDGSSEGHSNNMEANLSNEIDDMLYRLGAGEDNSGRSSVDADYKPHEGPIEEYSDEDEMMNESIKSIKTNFKRFL
jgi:hypothetical protein